MIRRQQPPQDQSCTQLGRCSLPRNCCHLRRTRRIRPPHCRHSRRTDPQCQVRHKCRIRLRRCPHNRRPEPRCQDHRTRRTRRAPRMNRRPQSHPGCSCKPRDRCNPRGIHMNHRRILPLGQNSWPSDPCTRKHCRCHCHQIHLQTCLCH